LKRFLLRRVQAFDEDALDSVGLLLQRLEVRRWHVAASNRPLRRRSSNRFSRATAVLGDRVSFARAAPPPIAGLIAVRSLHHGGLVPRRHVLNPGEDV